ncbi:MAG: 50S ribosomal protein L29 [Candidatus Aenigmarchaeota archaeon]|nr:50S ribosomal protein L29 [Candidatus Aenigmarchaeota archaeon]
MKSFKNLKALSSDDLNKKREELCRELIKERAQIAIGTIPKNPGRICLARKTIARINQILAKEAVKK